MSITNTFSGTLSWSATGKNTQTGDQSGSQSISDAINLTFAASGGTAPTISGFTYGTGTVTTGGVSLLVAHATNPMNGWGTMAYPEGFTVAGSKLKLLILHNTDATNYVTMVEGATNGLPIFDAVSHGVIIQPNGKFLWYAQGGTAALTTGSNDLLTLTANTASVSVTMTLIYGP